jgi:hypothetical protein
MPKNLDQMTAFAAAWLEEDQLPQRPGLPRLLEPLAEALLTRPDQNPEQRARRYVAPNKGTLSCFPAQKSVL